MHVAKLAQIDDFVNSLHNKYDTNVGDRGIRMSGGQRQRIGIARALYLKPTILVLDEATSALDSITEQVIIETIRSLSHKITIIMIAHRLSTVRECDTIYVMDKGNIVDSGAYSDLIESNLKFRQMANN
jgi:ABC-type multidrug transport system fused ATPase/permease subunit